MEGIEARSHTHGVMPGQREGPPHQSAQDALADGERDNVAFLSEKPGHEGSANQGERNENGIGPMKQGKDSAGEKMSKEGAIQGGEKTIGKVGVERKLLEKTESHVSDEAMGDKEMSERVVGPTESVADDEKSDDAG